MPRYSVIVEITKDVVVEAKDADAAYDKVEKIVQAAQTRGDAQVLREGPVDPLYSMDHPDIFRATEVTDDYVSGSGDDHVKVQRVRRSAG
jgi:hypothetical protein